MDVPQKPTPLLTVADVCEWLQLSERSVRCHVQRGTIPFRKVGRQLRFDRAEIEAWTKPERVPPPTRSVPATRASARPTPAEGPLVQTLRELGYR